MKENITMNITKDELKKLLLDYYEKENDDKNFDIIFDTNENNDYFSKTIETFIKIKRNIKIGNHIASIEEELDKDDIKKILTQMLSDTDYQVGYVIFETREECIGYYDAKEFTFNGLKIGLKRKQKQYTRK